MDQELFKFRAIIGHQGPLAEQIQIRRAANANIKWNGRLRRLLLNPSLWMTQSSVEHMPNNVIYLPWKVGVGSGALPRKMNSLQGQSSKVRSGKSADPKPTCSNYMETIHLTQKIKIANGMMPLSK